MKKRFNIKQNFIKLIFKFLHKITNYGEIDKSYENYKNEWIQNYLENNKKKALKEKGELICK